MTATAEVVEPVLTAVCPEPHGDVIRNVYPLQLSVENLKIFWEKSRSFKYIFDEEVGGDFKKFCELFMYAGPHGLQSNGLFWIIDDWVGMFYMTRIRPGIDAEVHYIFFDRRHRGRVDLAREMIKYAFRKYNFRRLSVEIPLYATKHAFEFITFIGFKKEGRRRKAIWHNDDWFDVAEFGILKEEALG
jgi:RimJ/RimL family protein N-acetyltransferase